jgi:hypothetical protein
MLDGSVVPQVWVTAGIEYGVGRCWQGEEGSRGRSQAEDSKFARQLSLSLMGAGKGLKPEGNEG